jgi:hypothetical protein
MMDERQKAFSLLLMMFWQYRNSILQPPLPCLNIEQDFIMILLLQLYFECRRKLCLPPPFYELRIRNRIVGDELLGPLYPKDVYSVLEHRPYEFWILSGETAESFSDLVLRVSRRLPNCNTGENYVSLHNRILLTMIWLRQYPTYTLLSLTFGISVPVVGRIITSIWPVLWEVVSPVVMWPTLQEWELRRGNGLKCRTSWGALTVPHMRFWCPKWNQRWNSIAAIENITAYTPRYKQIFSEILGSFCF